MSVSAVRANDPVGQSLSTRAVDVSPIFETSRYNYNNTMLWGQTIDEYEADDDSAKELAAQADELEGRIECVG